VAREGANQRLRLPVTRPGSQPRWGPRYAAELELRHEHGEDRFVLPLKPVVKLLPQQPVIATEDVNLPGQGPAEGGERGR
jgi:hypothetical protein